jgi:hypothetical protein
MSRSNFITLLLVAAAALIGLYGRFKGIGIWPLGVDEFYISRSVDHILQGGLPKFLCGGYYSRGLIFQYLDAGLRLAHLSPEIAGRLLAGVGSLLVLPAAYLLGRRVQGSQTGWLVVIVLLLSIWEIEMARFGRMYAPFQAVFCWYLVCYLRYTIDRKPAALIAMVLLSFVGVFTWEGGTLLGVANIFAVLQLHAHGRLRRGDWGRLAVLTVVLILLFLASRDLRDVGAAAADVAGGSPDAAVGGASPGEAVGTLATLRMHWPWCVAFLIPLALSGAAARFIGGFRRRWMSCAGLCLVLLAGLAHAFTAALGLLALMLLLDLVSWSELTTAHCRTFWAALLASLLFWLAYTHWAGGNAFLALVNQPDLFQRIARPWGRTMPLLTVAAVLGIAYLFKRSLAASEGLTPTKSLLTLLLLLVLAVGAIPTNRIETRYTFFLYPLIVTLLVSAVTRQRLAPWLAAVLILGCFAVGEDFQIRQVAHIDSAAVNFRIGMSSARADHYYPRNDMRGVAQWLQDHVAPGDVVLSGIPNLDQYYPRISSFYLEEDDNRYDAYVCPDGRTDRWTGHSIVEKIDRLTPAVDSSAHLYVTVYPDVEERLRQEGERRGWSTTAVFTALDGKTHVVSIQASLPTGHP